MDEEVDEPSTSTDNVQKSDMADVSSVESQIRTILAAGTADISESLLEQSVPEIESPDLLQQILDTVEESSQRELVSERLEELTGDTPEIETESDSDQSEPSESEQEDEPEPDMEIESFDDFEQALSDGLDAGDISSLPIDAIGEYGPDLSADLLEQAKDMATRTPANTRYDSFLVDKQLEQEDADTDTLFGEDDEVEEEQVEEEPEEVESPVETDTDDVTAESTADHVEADGGNETWQDAFSRASVETDSIDVKEAAEMENRWSILVWSKPGKGKTHFGYSSKEPVCIIDTEGKSHHLADDFEHKTVKLFQPSDYDEALENLHQAVEMLEQVKRESGRIGTLVVDSMSIMWEWSQQKYVDKFYRGKDADEVNFTSGMGTGGQSDWKQIKRYHNTMFRQAIIDSPFHFVWTAMSTDDYEAAIENDVSFSPKKPSGEKDNEYKASEVLRLRENENGVTVGELEKSDKVNHNYTGLKKPDYNKHKAVTMAIKDAENDNRAMSSVEAEFGVTVFEGNPRTRRITQNQKD
jgi:hypothetical protein